MTRLFVTTCIALLIPLAAFAKSIPLGAQRVSLSEFTVKADCATDATIDSITVQHSGLGDTADLLRVYLVEGEIRISPVASFSDHSTTLELRPRGLIVKACTTRTLRILADFSANVSAGGEHQLSVQHISSTQSVTIGKPDVTSSTVVPAPTGSVSVEYRDLLTSILYGSNRTLARIFLKATASFPQSLVSITLTNEGSARNADLQKLRLYNGNKLLAPQVASLSGDTLKFILDPPLMMGRSSSLLLTVKGDVRARARKTIDLKVDQPSDIEVIRASGSR